MDNSQRDYTTYSGTTQHYSVKIDPEFANKIPPIGEEEYKQLRENILAAGEVYEALVVWNGVLVDGHNRWKVVQENPNIKYKVREMDFADKWAAFDWMYRNQLGRRNLTDEQRTYTIGKMYEARKNSVGEHKGNQYTTVESRQNAFIPKNGRTPRTYDFIGKEIGVDGATVQRAGRFAKGVDALREVSPEAADKVLAGKANISKIDVQHIRHMQPDEVKDTAQKILNQEPIKREKTIKRGAENGNSRENRELRELLRNVVAAQTDIDGAAEYTIDSLVEDIEVNGATYVNNLRNMLANRRDLMKDADDKIRVFKVIASIIQDMTKVRGEYTK